MIAKCDEKGRLYIPKKYQSKINGEVYLVELKEGLMIIPVPKDPIAQLQSIGQSIPNITLSKMKAIINEEAMKEVTKQEK
jgi:DNA-binding transcriptional regulator/RsmH inhibitor MraZ